MLTRIGLIEVGLEISEMIVSSLSKGHWARELSNPSKVLEVGVAFVT
jgi:hypothetical protein